MIRIFKRIVRYSRSHPTGLVVAWVFALFLLTLTIIIIHERIVAQNHVDTDTQWSLITRPITSRDHVIGDISAPIQLVVFADFQCRYCGTFFNITVPKLQAEFGNKIVLAFRHLPLLQQPQAQQEAEASECVYQLGGNVAFWKFSHEMYAIPGFYNGIDLSALPDIAQKTGIDRAEFSTCFNSGKGKSRVAQDKLEGSIAGLDITPSVVLKSAHRAVIVKGNYYAQISAGIRYLLETNAQIDGMTTSTRRW